MDKDTIKDIVKDLIKELVIGGELSSDAINRFCIDYNNIKVKPTINITSKVEHNGLVWDVLDIDVDNNEIRLGRYSEVFDYYDFMEKTVKWDIDDLFNT